MLTLKDRIILIINGKNDIFFSYNLFFFSFLHDISNKNITFASI